MRIVLREENSSDLINVLGPVSVNLAPRMFDHEAE